MARCSPPSDPVPVSPATASGLDPPVADYATSGPHRLPRENARRLPRGAARARLGLPGRRNTRGPPQRGAVVGDERPASCWLGAVRLDGPHLGSPDRDGALVPVMGWLIVFFALFGGTLGAVQQRGDADRRQGAALLLARACSGPRSSAETGLRRDGSCSPAGPPRSSHSPSSPTGTTPAASNRFEPIRLVDVDSVERPATPRGMAWPADDRGWTTRMARPCPSGGLPCVLDLRRPSRRSELSPPHGRRLSRPRSLRLFLHCHSLQDSGPIWLPSRSIWRFSAPYVLLVAAFIAEVPFAHAPRSSCACTSR